MRLGPAGVALALALVTAGGTTAAVVGIEDGPLRSEVIAQPAAFAEPSLLPLQDVAEPPLEPLPPMAPVPLDPPLPAPVSVTTTPPPVAPLRALKVPDLLIRTPAPLTRAQVAELADLDQLEGMATFRTAPVVVRGKRVTALGVDPSQFRAFTPQESARSDRLWEVVARGEMVSSFSLGRSNPLPLGDDVNVIGSTAEALRHGARAALGVPGADLLVDRATIADLGRNGGGAVVSAPERDLDSLVVGVRAALGKDVDITLLRAEPVSGIGRPSSYRELYQRSALLCPGLSWTVLAAIGQIESGHGVNLGPSSAGALGPMQFMPATWAAYGVDGDSDGTADIMSPFDSVPAAAGYLCRNGAGRGGDDLYNAVFAYNHADWYVRKVLGLAAKYS